MLAGACEELTLGPLAGQTRKMTQGSVPCRTVPGLFFSHGRWDMGQERASAWSPRGRCLGPGDGGPLSPMSSTVRGEGRPSLPHLPPSTAVSPRGCHTGSAAGNAVGPRG